jgi:hypothetical protein
MMLGGIVYRGATVILPAYFELKNQQIFLWLASTASGGLSKNLVATSLTSIIFLVGMLGQYTGGRIAERYAPKYGYLIFHMLTIPAAFLFLPSGDATDRKHFGGQFYTQKVSSFSLWHQVCFNFRGGSPGC